MDGEQAEGEEGHRNREQAQRLLPGRSSSSRLHPSTSIGSSDLLIRRAGVLNSRCALLKTVAAAATKSAAKDTLSVCDQYPTSTGKAPQATANPQSEWRSEDHSNPYPAASTTPTTTQTNRSGEMTKAPATPMAAAATRPPTPRPQSAASLSPVRSGRSWTSSRAWAPIPRPKKKASRVAGEDHPVQVESQPGADGDVREVPHGVRKMEQGDQVAPDRARTGVEGADSLIA